MKKAYVITEGPFDAEILKQLLSAKVLRDTEFVVAHGRYGAQSVARTLLATRHIPVALVVDADTTDEARIAEQKDFLEELLRQASSGTRFQVFLIKPGFDPQTIKSLSQAPLIADLEKFLSSIAA